MRRVHYENREVALTDVHVYMHDSGMTCSHDYACPVCSKNPAVLHLGRDAFQPCWTCQKEGWAVTYTKPKVPLKTKIARIFSCLIS